MNDTNINMGTHSTNTPNMIDRNVRQERVFIEGSADHKQMGVFCKHCDQNFSQIKTLIRHYNKEHEYAIVIKNKHFRSRAELDSFVDKNQKTSYYTCTTTNTKYLDGVTTVYHKCNYFKEGRRICPCFITIKSCQANNSSVSFYLTHNHNPDWATISIPPFFKNALIAKLKNKNSIDDIYDEIRTSFDTEDIRKESLITKKYLYYLRDKIATDSRAYKDDFKNTEHLLINEYADDLKLYSFKDIETNKEGHSSLKNEFVLIISTHDMIYKYEKFSGKGVLFDSTHNTNRYGVLLIVGLVINENQQGCPFIYILTTSEKETVLDYCFKKFKSNQNATIPPPFLMSDCYNGFYNSWSRAFGYDLQHLWCEYHVKKSWYKNIIRFSSSEKVKQKLRNMMAYLIMIIDKVTFERELERILKLTKDICPNYHSYFIRHYKNTCDKWASYNRELAEFNTNNFCESWFGRFKRGYLKGYTKHRFDSLIIKLMKILDDDIKENKIRNVDKSITRMTYRQKVSNQNHDKIKEFSDHDFKYIGRFKFTYKDYTICYLDMQCPFKCNAECIKCNVCHHQVHCSCIRFIRNNYICKHIHQAMVLIRSKKASNTNFIIEKEQQRNKTEDAAETNKKEKHLNMEKLPSSDTIKFEEALYHEKIQTKQSSIEKKLIHLRNLASKQARLHVLDFTDDSIDYITEKIQNRINTKSVFEIEYLNKSNKATTQRQMQMVSFNPLALLKYNKKPKPGRPPQLNTVERECCKICFVECIDYGELDTEWAGCDVCKNWYHKICINNLPLDYRQCWKCNQC